MLRVWGSLEATATDDLFTHGSASASKTEHDIWPTHRPHSGVQQSLVEPMVGIRWPSIDRLTAACGVPASVIPTAPVIA